MPPDPVTSPRAELQRARRSVFAEYVRQHGRVPSARLVDELLKGAWYRLSDAAHDLLHRSRRR